MKSRQYVLMILDGVGINELETGNAFMAAKTPNLDLLMKRYHHASIKTSGEAVGLPDGQMGNSEVGHTSIGSGRIVYQELTRITKSIADGDFFDNRVLLDAVKKAKDNNKSLHLMGLLSDGGVHSHEDHLYALIELARRHGLDRVYIHAFLDGRDTLPDIAGKFVDQLEDKISKSGVGKIATVSGRYYAMDRDNHWDRVEIAYNALTLGDGDKCASAREAIEKSYNNKVYDEFVKPSVMVDEKMRPIATIKDGDSVIFFNFRPDRARQITKALIDPSFSGFNRKVVLRDLHFVTMTDYDKSVKNVSVAFKPQNISQTFGEYISSLGYTQLRVAETEKYAHVTFFFNGGEEKQYGGENRILVPSPKVATYDLKPEMSAYEVTDEVVNSIDSKKYDVIIVNFANGDMVGHTGSLEKTIKAVETLDECIGKIMYALNVVDGEAIITADHGNCEYMIDPKTGATITSHSTFDVPIIVVSKRVKNIKDGRLCDITPTLLHLMDEPVPKAMTGKSLISK